MNRSFRKVSYISKLEFNSFSNTVTWIRLINKKGALPELYAAIQVIASSSVWGLWAGLTPVPDNTSSSPPPIVSAGISSWLMKCQLEYKKMPLLMAKTDSVILGMPVRKSAAQIWDRPHPTTSDIIHRPTSAIAYAGTHPNCRLCIRSLTVLVG